MSAINGTNEKFVKSNGKKARKPPHLNTRTLTSHLFFGPYVFFPLLATLVWLGGILALLLLWVTNGKPRYRGDEATVVFISDVGAVHKKVFIGIAATTSGLYIMSLFAERWLRHIDRLPTDLRRREKIFDWVAIVFGIIGAAGLILCSIFDAFNYSYIHWPMALVFIVGTALSGIFQSAEIWSLHKDHPDRKSLLRNSIFKLIIVTIAILGAIAFGVTYGLCGGNPFATSRFTANQCNSITSACAALEWTIAFLLTFYYFTLVLDLWPAGKSSERYMRRLARWQEKHGQGDDFTGRRAFEEHPERWMTAEQREEAMRREIRAKNTGQAINHEEQNIGNGYIGNGPMLEGTPRHSEASGAPLVGRAY